MLSGQLSFKGERETSIMYSIVHGEHKHLNDIKPNAPSELERIIDCSLAKKAESRYSSVTDMVDGNSTKRDMRQSKL
jgi:hypothetical protein